MNCPPPAGSPRFARGTAPGSVPPARRGNLKEGFSFIRAFMDFGLAIGIIASGRESGTLPTRCEKKLYCGSVVAAGVRVWGEPAHG